MLPPQAPAGSPAGHSWAPHPSTCVGARGFVCAKGGRGTKPPGHIPPALEEQDVSSPSSVPPPQHSWAEGRGEGRAEAVGPSAAIPGKRGQPCGEEGSAGAFPGSPRARQPLPQRLGRGRQRPGPPATPRGSGSALPVLRRLRDAGRAQQSMNGRSGFLPPRRPPGAGGSSCSALAS